MKKFSDEDLVDAEHFFAKCRELQVNQYEVLCSNCGLKWGAHSGMSCMDGSHRSFAVEIRAEKKDLKI